MNGSADLAQKREALAAPADFVRAMGQHVASVCVITTSVGGERFGLTATAVSSVTATPPRLLVCVNKSGVSHSKIAEAGRFCVNVLEEDQDPVAKAFAGMLGAATERFGVGAWTALKTGSPVLVGAAAAFDCIVAGIIDQGTHSLFLGDVAAVSSDTARDSLLYGSRRFRRLRKIFSQAPDDIDETLHF